MGIGISDSFFLYLHTSFPVGRVLRISLCADAEKRCIYS